MRAYGVFVSTYNPELYACKPPLCTTFNSLINSFTYEFQLDMMTSSSFSMISITIFWSIFFVQILSWLRTQIYDAQEITWNFHLCPNGEISQNSLSCLVIHKAWKGICKEWEFCSCPLIDNGNVHLDVRNNVNGTFCLDDGNMLLGSFFKGKFQKINHHIHSIHLM